MNIYKDFREKSLIFDGAIGTLLREKFLNSVCRTVFEVDIVVKYSQDFQDIHQM